MKASASLLFLFLIAAGCTDATTDPTGLKPPASIAGAAAGNPPPPPVDAVVVVCIGGGCAAFDGAYMSNTTEEAVTAAVGILQLADGACSFPGHASIKINDQLEPQIFNAQTSANAAIKCNHLRASGGGMIEINGIEVQLDDVLAFDNPPDCTARCGEFTALDEDGNVASGVVFERDYYEEVCENNEGENGFCFPGDVIG